MAYEKVMLYGLPVVAKRLVNYSNIDATLSREIFIRSALVEGEWRQSIGSSNKTVIVARGRRTRT